MEGLSNYIINVLMSMTWVIPVLAAIGFIAWKIPAKYDKVRKAVANGIWYFLLIAFIFAAIQPFNTYKNTVDYNKEQDLRIIKAANEAKVVAPIVDTSRQPMSTEERADRFAELIDYSEKVPE